VNASVADEISLLSANGDSCEALTQLPFFFVATYALLKRESLGLFAFFCVARSNALIDMHLAVCATFAGKNWIRVPFIIYGAHVATTVIPMLAEFAAAEQLSVQQRLTLISL
jgi:hypothetical protein